MTKPLDFIVFVWDTRGDRKEKKMPRKQESRPPISFRVDSEIVDTLENMAAKSGVTRAAVTEELIKNALGNPVLKPWSKPSSPVISEDQKKEKEIKGTLEKRAEALPVSAKKGFWDFMEDMPNLFGNSKAIDRALADPAKLVKDSAAAIKTMKTVVGFAALGVALLPLLPYFKEQLANIKAAKAAEPGTSPASATSPQTEKVVGLPLGAGKEPFITEIVKSGIL
jgi:hypothetical protein